MMDLDEEEQKLRNPRFQHRDLTTYEGELGGNGPHSNPAGEDLALQTWPEGAPVRTQRLLLLMLKSLANWQVKHSPETISVPNEHMFLKIKHNFKKI